MTPPVDIRQAEGLRRLSELMLRVNSSADLPEVLNEITSGVVEILGHELAFISEVQGNKLAITAAAGPTEAGAELTGLSAELGHSAVVCSESPNCAELFFSMAADSQVMAHLGEGARSRFLCNPLLNADGVMLGCLGVLMSPDAGPPGKEDQDLLDAFAAQAGLALHNLQTRSLLGKRLRLGNAIRALAEVSELDNLEETLRDHGPELNKQFDVDMFRIRILRSGEDDLSSIFIIPPSPPDHQSRWVADQVARVAASSRQPIEVRLDDGAIDPAGSIFEQGRATMQSMGLATCLLCPILVGNQYYGYVTLGRSDPGAYWDQPELDAAEDLGRNLGRVVANWRLLERERQLVEELQALDRYRTELIATISHELKTPLTAIIGHVELLEDADDGDISISAISRNAQRLDRLVANLLTYSHALHADIGDRRLINLNDVVGDGVELIRAQAEANQVELKLEHVSSENWVLGDPEELGKVVINLLSNAVKYSRSGGKVEISVDGNETYRELRVTDHGIGISKADQQNLFSAFNRSSNQEVLSIPGTGLGLAISRRIAQMNGGEILVDSDLGVGSSFRFRLPAQVPANGFTV